MKFRHLIGVSIILLVALMAWGCGDPPSSLPFPYTGEIGITAVHKTTIDSVRIEIDNISYGRRANPCVITGVVVGVHRLFVSGSGLSGSAAMIEVLHNRRSDVLFTLRSEGPYVEDVAPDFAAKTITDDSISLQQMKGKVILLVFFEHT